MSYYTRKDDYRKAADSLIADLEASRRWNAQQPPHTYSGPLPNIRQTPNFGRDVTYVDMPGGRDMPEGRE